MTDNEKKIAYLEGYFKAYEDMREGIDRVLAVLEAEREALDDK